MKILKQAYTAEFKEMAVKRIKDGQIGSVVCKEFWLSDQTVRNWVRAAAEGKLNGSGGRGRDAGGNGTLPAADREYPAQAGA